MRKAADSKSMYVTQAAGSNKPPTFEQDETAQTGDTPYGDDTNTLIDLMPFGGDPVDTDAVVQLEIKEDASVGAMVGPGPIAATDPDEGDELTYSIEATTPPDRHRFGSCSILRHRPRHRSDHSQEDGGCRCGLAISAPLITYVTSP